MSGGREGVIGAGISEADSEDRGVTPKNNFIKGRGLRGLNLLSKF